MTRQEITGIRSLTFSQWIRTNLPDSSTGFSATDIDFVLYNWQTKKVMILEVKINNGYVRFNQAKLFGLMDKWISKGIDKDWTYLGLHTIVFERNDFEDGRCYLNGHLITESELIKFLSMI